MPLIGAAEQFSMVAGKIRADAVTVRKRNNRQGHVMKLFWGLGKVLTLGFWLVVLVNTVLALPNPFDLLINMAGSLLLLTHLLELVLFNGSLRGRMRPWMDRGQILLFGIFHLQTFSRSQAEIAHA